MLVVARAALPLAHWRRPVTSARRGGSLAGECPYLSQGRSTHSDGAPWHPGRSISRSGGGAPEPGMVGRPLQILGSPSLHGVWHSPTQLEARRYYVLCQRNLPGRYSPAGGAGRGLRPPSQLHWVRQRSLLCSSVGRSQPDWQGYGEHAVARGVAVSCPRL